MINVLGGVRICRGCFEDGGRPANFRDVAIAEWRSRSMTEVPSLAYRIEQARRHIEVGRLLIERQKEMVERHRLEGRDTKPAQDLLTAFEHTQQVFERDLTRLEQMEQ